VRAAAEAGGPLLFGVLADALAGSGGKSHGAQLAFLIMLVPLALNGLLLAPALRTYGPDVAAALGAEPRAILEQVLREADFVSLHCPATPETRHLMNRERLAQMRSDAYLINTARGDVVDEAALVEALTSRRLAGAGLDVFEKEPEVTPALLAMENVVLLPHLGSATRETRVAMGMRALENLRLFFKGSPLRDRVV